MLDHESRLHRPIQIADRAELTPEGPDIGAVLPGGTIMWRAVYGECEVCAIVLEQAIEGNRDT